MLQARNKLLDEEIVKFSRLLEELGNNEPRLEQRRDIYKMLRASGIKAPLVVAAKLSRMSKAKFRKPPRDKNGQLNLGKVYESIE